MSARVLILLILAVLCRAESSELPLSAILKTRTRAELKKLITETNMLKDFEARCRIELSIDGFIPSACYRFFQLQLKFKKIPPKTYGRMVNDLDVECHRRYISGHAQVNDPKMIPRKSTCRKLSETLYEDQRYQEADLVRNL